MRARRLRALLDERDPTGGRAKALLFLCHPGPSLLVTGVTTVASTALSPGRPSATRALRTVLVVLPSQLAVGAANDLADVADDRRAKPHKPLVSGRARPREALAVAVAGSATSLGSALSLGPGAVAVAVAGLGAGLAHDLGAKRTTASWLPWWGGLACVPLGAAAGAGRLDRPTVAAVVPLAGLLSLALHCANGLPDIEGDRAAGSRSLPVRLGASRSRQVGGAAAAAAAAGAVITRGDGPGRAATAPAAALLTGLGLAVAARVVPTRMVFPVTAIGAAALSATWLTSRAPRRPGATLGRPAPLAQLERAAAF